MAFSTLFSLDTAQLTTEAEVETRLLSRIFDDLGYPMDAIVPKKRIKKLSRVNFALRAPDGFSRLYCMADKRAKATSAWMNSRKAVGG